MSKTDASSSGQIESVLQRLESVREKGRIMRQVSWLRMLMGADSYYLLTAIKESILLKDLPALRFYGNCQSHKQEVWGFANLTAGLKDHCS